MSPKKQETLFTRYPGIFRDHTKLKTESCMHWGIETDDGWYALIDALCVAIQRPYTGSCLAEADGSNDMFQYEFPQVIADQVKTKFATLRFYYHLEPDVAFEEQAKRYPKTARELLIRFSSYVDGAIGMAEMLSARTCEETGCAGELCIRGGYYRTLCPEEATKNGFIPVREKKEMGVVVCDRDD